MLDMVRLSAVMLCWKPLKEYALIEWFIAIVPELS